MRQYIVFSAVLLLLAVCPVGSGYAQECVATGDVDCSGSLTIADLALIIDFFDGSQAEPACAWQMDVNGDCLVDRVDFQLLIDCLDGPGPDCPTVTTCCDPWLRHNCCMGLGRGDVNGDGDDVPTIGDISLLIDAKFVSSGCEGLIGCLIEADVNESGGDSPDCDDITIGDISTIIDFLYVTGPEVWCGGYPGIDPCVLSYCPSD